MILVSVPADGSNCLQASPSSETANLPQSDIEALTKRTQEGGTEVVTAKAGKVSSTASSPP